MDSLQADAARMMRAVSGAAYRTSHRTLVSRGAIMDTLLGRGECPLDVDQVACTVHLEERAGEVSAVGRDHYGLSTRQGARQVLRRDGIVIPPEVWRIIEGCAIDKARHDPETPWRAVIAPLKVAA